MQAPTVIERTSLTSFAVVVLRFWWLPILASALGVLLALFYISRSQPMYEAKMILAPQQNFVSGGRASSSGGLGSLLSGLGAGGGGDVAKLEIMLKSDRLARLAWSDKVLLKQMFPGNWDARARAWRPRDKGFGAWLLHLVHVKLPAEPTPDDVQAKIASLVVKPEQQVYRNITLSAPDPDAAQAVLKALVELSDRTLRADDRGRLDKMIDYTTRRLAGVTVTRQAEALSGLLLTLEQQRMLATASTYYTFDLIQDAQADFRPVSPRPLVALATGLVVLPTLAIISLLVFAPRRRGRRHY